MRTRRTLVAAVVVLLPVLGACSSSEDVADEGDPTTTTSTTASSPSTAQPTDTDPATTEPATPTVSRLTTPSVDGRVNGSAYSVVMPDGWTDITATVKASQPSVDIAIGEGVPSGFRTNFNVVDSTTDPGTIEDNGPAIRKEAASELKSITKTAVQPLPDRTIGGDTAIGQTSSFVSAGTSVTFIQYFVVHDNDAYPITMTFASDNAASAKTVLDQILATWQWAS